MNLMIRYVIYGALILISGCAVQPSLTDSEIESRYPEISKLQHSIEMADAQDVNLLSAMLYKQAKQQYSSAMALAKGGDNRARTVAGEGLATIERASASALKATDELAIVLQARTRALNAKADVKNNREFESAEQSLKELGNLVARGDVASARDSRQVLAKRYARLELDALKTATAGDAQQQIREAMRVGAGNYAPKTLEQAADELELSKTVLESDTGAQDQAADHALQAFQLASRAIQITEIIKEFKQSNMTDEQVVLWYQTQLANTVVPVVASPDFGQPNKALIAGLATEIEAVVAMAQENEQTLRQTKALYANETAEMTLARARQDEFEARFRTIQKSFTSDEAEVYRQDNNVLIRSYGINFPSGGSEIRADNYPLLQKIITATGEFPTSDIRVSGHTDDRGSDQLNMALSSQRADKVARFLVDVGNLAQARVSSVGFGKSQPLASNETTEGRTANRRVEILIVNE